MIQRSRILQVLAGQFASRKAGRTGAATNRPTFQLTKLLEAASCAEGEARELAEEDLKEAERLGVLERVPFHPRDPGRIEKIRVPVEQETALFTIAGLPSPTQERAALAAQFVAAAEATVPDCWNTAWLGWCERMRLAALAGRPVEPFDRHPTDDNTKLLMLLPQLLAWRGESLVRFASCVLCGDSKALESLSQVEPDGPLRGKMRGKLGRLLEDITAGEIRTLDDIGILPNPRFALVHGPLKLNFAGAWLDLGQLQGAFRLAEADIVRASGVETDAKRCLTVENEATFHELAKLQSGELLIQTSYRGYGTLKLLERLPHAMEFWHFGDSDQAGFDILRDLRERSGRDFQALHMEPGRIPHEQEALGRPSSSKWPFYNHS